MKDEKREIKFRIWHKKLGMFINPEFIGHTINTIFSDEADYVLQQYIGIKDKNNKEIYEGDIILLFGQCKYEVIYDRLGFLFLDIRTRFKYDLKDVEEKEFEVIGNIFENPQLNK